MSASAYSGVTLVLGPPNSGKRGLALEWWQERLEQRPLVVMPTAPDARDMSAEMARRTGGLVGQSSALTFQGLVRMVLEPPRRFVGEFERTVVLAQLLRSVPLEALGCVTHLPGVANAVGKLLQELGESGKSAEQVGEALERWAEAEPASASLSRDVRLLAVEYDAELRRLGLGEQAAAVLEAATQAAGWRSPMAFCGFTSFTHGQRALVQRLARQTEILVTLDYDRDRGVGLCAPGEAEWWAERAAEVIKVSTRTRAYASAGIAHLERFFLGGESPAVAPPVGNESEGVRFLLSSGRRAEAEAVAEQITRLINAGFEPGGIAVVVRQMRSWGGLLGDVFASCGIPYQADHGRRLAETGLGYAFLRAVRGATTDDADALLSYLRTPYSGAEAEDVCDLEARYRQGAARGVEALHLLAGRRMGSVLEPVRALAGARAAVEPAPAAPVRAGAAPPGQLDLVAAGALAERMLLQGARDCAVGSPHLEADAAAYSALAAGLTAMIEIAGRLEPEVALRLLSQAGVPESLHADAGAVQIISAQRARARRFDAVFVLGLVEGEFPGLVEAPSLLSGRQRASLDALGGGLFPQEPQGERALFVGAATRAWRLLFLSARDAEDDGGEAMPSRFWTEAKTLLGAGAQEHEGRTLAEQVFAVDSAPSMRHYLRACAAAGSEPRADLLPPGTVGAPPPWHRSAARLSAPAVLSYLQALDCFSPSTLEAYLRCPFAWFIERVVGQEDLEAELDGRVLGDLIHGVLSECYRSLAADGLLPLTGDRVSEAQKRADVLIDAAVEGPGCPGTRAERRVAACRLQGMARRLFEAEATSGGTLVFNAAEVVVGEPEGVDIGGLRLRGRIDRIDITPGGEGLFVYDYKSGTIPAASALGTGDGLQLPLYLLALQAERKDAQVVGGAYLSLGEGGLAGVVSAGREGVIGARAGKCRALDEPAWQELADGVLTVAQTSAAGMRSGVITPEADRVCPSWCDLGPVCRSRQGGHRP